MTVNTIFTIILCAAAAGGFAFAWRKSAWPAQERVLSALIPVLLCVIAMGLTVDVASGYFRPWNNARLAPGEALLHGGGLYCADDGPLLGAMYPPLSYLLYLPASLLPTPYSSITVGLVLTVFFMLAPGVVFVSLACRRNQLSPTWAIGLSILFILIHMTERGMSLPGVWIHVDHPGNAFLVAGVAVVWFMGPSPRSATVYLGAACVVLALWCKQTFAPFLVSMPLVVWLLHGRPALVRYLVAMLIVGLFTAVAGLLTIDPRTMWLNVVTLPAAQPWRIHGPSVVGVGLMVMGMGASFAWFLLCAYGVLATRIDAGPRPERLLDRHRWVVLGVPILLAMPLSFVGLAKTGGDWNHVTSVALLATLGAMLLIIDCISRVQRAGVKSYAAALALVLPVGLMVATAGLVLQGRGPYADSAWAAYRDNPEIRAYAYSLANPRRVYFPYHPLTTLKSENRAYHFSDAVFNRLFAGIGVSNSQFNQWLPEQLQTIAIYGTEDDPIRNSLPQFTERFTDPRMPGWILYRRPAK